MDIRRPVVRRDTSQYPADNVVYVAASARERCFALGVSVAIVMLAVVLVPFGGVKGPEIAAFVPAVGSAVVLAMALTASLLFAQYRANAHVPFAVLALAYASAAALLLVHVLVFPRVFGEAGLLGAGPQTALWIYSAWHIVFASTVLLYVGVEHAGPDAFTRRAARRVAVASAALVTSIILVATLGHSGLPVLVVNGSFTPLYRIAVVPAILGALLAAGVTLVVCTRLRTRGHVWLAVVLLALGTETILIGYESGGRYTYGWYVARVQLAVAATALLMMLQSQYAAILERVTSANANLEARNRQVQAFIRLQDAVAAALPSRAAVVQVILDFAQRETGTSASALELIDGDELVYEAAQGSLEPFVGMRLHRAGSLSGMCADSDEILLCEDTATDPRVNREACARTGIRSMIVVPIGDASRVAAVLKVAAPDPYAFDHAGVQALALAAKNLSSGLFAAQEFATLETSERRYRALTNVMPQLVGVVDRELRLIYINDRCSTYSGASIDALNDRSNEPIVHPADRHYVTVARAAVDSGSEFACEVRLRRADDTYRWHSVHAVPLDTLATELGEWLFAATDIQERKAAETSIVDASARLERSAQTDRAVATGLREANRLLRMAEEMAHVGLYRIDFVAHEMYWSDEVYRTHDLPPTFKPTIEGALSAFHSNDRDRVRAIVETSLADGSPFTIESQIVRADGVIRDIVLGGQAERDADGTIVGLFGIFQDVTSIKEAERERDRLSERAMLAAKAGNIGIWEWDTRTGFAEWDSTMFALYGITDPTVVPDYGVWSGCIHPGDVERAGKEMDRALHGDAPFDTEFRIVWPSGEVRHIRALGTVLNGSSEHAPRLIGTNWDITELRVLSAALSEAKERAEAGSRAKSEFLARMSHEIRTPMNGIIGFTTLVLDGELSAEQRRHLLLLKDAGKSLLAIINDVLDFSKIEAGKIDLESIALSPNALVDGALSIVRTEARPKGIRLDADVASDVPAWVTGDPTRLRQILLNLLTNALKFTERGSVSVRVRRDAGDLIRFEVADTGIGIAAEHRHLLFTNFSQLEKSTTRRYGGTGLGLAISKRLVEAMGGTIGLDSTAGAGSVFWFTASLKMVAPPESSPFAESRIPLMPRRILVADDNRVNQIVVENMLVRDGHTVILVENGLEALAAIERGPFDLVLMDMQMPVMDGLDATRAIRALPAPSGLTPIVALTANAMAEEVDRCTDAGMNAHLAKPIDRELLRSALERWTSQDQPLLPAAERTAAPAAHHYIDTPTLGIATLLDIFDDDMASVGAILEVAMASIDVDLARIEHSAAVRDVETLLAAAHRMKGTSGSIRSQRIIALSTSIELAAKADGWLVDAALVATLGEAVSRLRCDLETHRRTTGATS